MAAQAFDYDFFVIGGGSGGVRAARIAAGHGARVGIAEADRYGGTCVIRGCVPKKMLVYASEWSEGFEDAAAYGWDLTAPSLDWSRLVSNMDTAIARLEGHYISGLENAGATVYRGFGQLVDAHTVRVGDDHIRADKLLIATGARPFVPDIEGIEHAITSDQAFHLPALPEHAVVVGGGYIGVEFAHIFRGLGSRVSLVHRGDNVLRGFDHDIREQVQQGLERRDIALHMPAKVKRIAPAAGAGDYRVLLDTGTELVADCVLFATGREPNTDKLGADTVGLALDEFGAVIVDEYSRTNIESIYAVGDCTPRAQLTPVAIRDGHALADSLFGGIARPVDHQLIPTAVFAQPPASTVGMSEEDARAQYAGVDIYKTQFRALQHSLPRRSERVMMKLVVDADTDRVLGAHVVGVEAAEIIQCVAIAIKMGATKADFDRTIAIHPTTAEEIVTIREKYTA